MVFMLYTKKSLDFLCPLNSFIGFFRQSPHPGKIFIPQGDWKQRMGRLLLFLLLIASVAADDSYFYPSSMLSDLTFSGGASMEGPAGSSVETLKAEVELDLKESGRQDVVDLQTFPDHEMNEGRMVFSWDRPGDTVRFRIMSSLENRLRQQAIAHDPFPVRNVPEEIRIYLEPSEKIDIDPDIEDLANMLAEGEEDEFSVVVNLAGWVHRNIEYSMSTLTSEASQRSSWVLDNRIGVCDEITNLFISLCRSVGIPARFVSGIAYSNTGKPGFGLHGWAEVYFPNTGWVPFDVTYGQLGYIDAAHIKMRDSPDSDKALTRYTWKAVDKRLEPLPFEHDVSVRSVGGPAIDPVRTRVSLISTEVGFGSYNVIRAEIENTLDGFVATEASLTLPEEVDVIGDKRQFLAIPPKGRKTAAWIVRVDSSLDPSFMYSFPVTVRTSLNGSDHTSFTASRRSSMLQKEEAERIVAALRSAKSYSESLDLSCGLPEHAYSGEAIMFNCTVTNTGNRKLEAEICAGGCMPMSLGISETEDIGLWVTAGDVGEQMIVVSCQAGELTEARTYTVKVIDRPQLVIEMQELPEKARFGEELTVKFVLKRLSQTVPEDATVYFEINGNRREWERLDLSEEIVFEIKVPGDTLDLENDLSIGYEAKDILGTGISGTEKHGLAMEDPGLIGRLQLMIGRLGRAVASVFG